MTYLMFATILMALSLCVGLFRIGGHVFGGGDGGMVTVFIQTGLSLVAFATLIVPLWATR
jgi:hypothetical protein